jgi:hypothetical protein
MEQRGLKHAGFDVSKRYNDSDEIRVYVVVVHYGIWYSASVNRKKKQINRTELRLGRRHERNFM